MRPCRNMEQFHARKMVGHCSAVARVFSFVSFPKSSRLFLRTTQHAFQLVENFPLPSSYSSSSSSTSSSSSFSSSSSTRNRKQVFFSGASLIFSIRPNLFGSMKCAKIRCNFFKKNLQRVATAFSFFFLPNLNEFHRFLPRIQPNFGSSTECSLWLRAKGSCTPNSTVWVYQNWTSCLNFLSHFKMLTCFQFYHILPQIFSFYRVLPETNRHVRYPSGSDRFFREST